MKKILSVVALLAVALLISGCSQKEFLRTGFYKENFIGYIDDTPYFYQDMNTETINSVSDGEIVKLDIVDRFSSHVKIHNNNFIVISWDEEEGYLIKRYDKKGFLLEEKYYSTVDVSYFSDNSYDLEIEIFGDKLIHIDSSGEGFNLIAIDLNTMDLVHNSKVSEDTDAVQILNQYYEVLEDSFRFVVVNYELEYYYINIDSDNYVTMEPIKDIILMAKYFDYAGSIDDLLYTYDSDKNTIKSLDMISREIKEFDLEGYKLDMFDTYKDKLILSKIDGSKTIVRELDKEFKDLKEVELDKKCSYIEVAQDNNYICSVWNVNRAPGIFSDSYDSEQYVIKL